MDGTHDNEDVPDADVEAKMPARRSLRKRQVPAGNVSKDANENIDNSPDKDVSKKVGKKVGAKVGAAGKAGKAGNDDSPSNSTSTDTDSSRISPKRKFSETEVDMKGPMTRARKKRLSASSASSAELSLP